MEGSIKSRQLAEEAIALDPNTPLTYSGWWGLGPYVGTVWFQVSESPEESMKLAVDAAQKALTLDDSDPLIHTCFSSLYIMQRKHGSRLCASAERALELSPSGARAHGSLGSALSFACRFSEKHLNLEQAIRLDPFPSSIGFRNLGGACPALVGRYKENISNN